MRLRQLLAVITAIMLGSVLAAAAGSQLTNVSVVSQGNSTTVTMQASGTFVHKESRASDKLLLVDLTGVSAGKLHGREKKFDVPGVDSYRVIGYKGVGGTDVARLELRLTPGADVNVADARGGVSIVVAPKDAGTGALASAAVAASKPVTTPAAATRVAESGETVKVRQISVARGRDGMEVEIAGTAPMTANVLKLSSPNRIVVDVANAIPGAKPKPIIVNSGDVKDVRMGQFKAAPPVTRVVVDLTAEHDYELSGAGDKLVLKLRPAGYAQKTSAPAESKPVMAATSPAVVPVAMKETAPVQPQTEKPVVVANASGKTKGKPAAAKTTTPKTVQTAGFDSFSTADRNSRRASEPKVAAAMGTTEMASAEVKPLQSMPAPVSADSKASKEVASAQVPATPTVKEAAVQSVSTSPVPVSEKEAKGDSEQGGAKAQDFAFVEPTYRASGTNETGTAAQKTSEPAAKQQAMAQEPVPTAEPKPQAPTPKQSVNFAADQKQGPANISPAPKYTGEPISVNLKDVDLKDFFRLIHEISGLNIVLDPSVNGRVTLVLDDVPWDQALDLVLKNNSLDRELQGNVLRIASVESLRKEAQEKRLQIEAQALAVEKVNVTRFLSYAHAKDVLPTVKKLLSARGDIVADDRTNALVIQDIPSVIPEIDRLISQLDRKTMEVEIEARVVAATRTFARDIGAQVGFGTGSNSFAVGGASAVGTSNIIANGLTPSYIVSQPTSGSSTTGQVIPLFSSLLPTTVTSGLSFINATNAYRLDVILGAAESRGLLKILSRPRVVTQNNVQALVKQGYRIPVVTLGQLGGPPTVTYIEAVLRLTVTPQITVENTIFLNVDIENTTPDFSRQVMGNPVFLTQQATTQVLVTDGGTVMIGGVIQTNNAVTINQVPYLGSVPVLGNLFKHRNVQNTTQELIFILTPKIVQT